MQVDVNSSSIKSINVDNSGIQITFLSNQYRTYQYKYSPEFQAGLEDVIARQYSVGRYVNHALREGILIPA